MQMRTIGLALLIVLCLHCPRGELYREHSRDANQTHSDALRSSESTHNAVRWLVAGCVLIRKIEKEMAFR